MNIENGKQSWKNQEDLPRASVDLDPHADGSPVMAVGKKAESTGDHHRVQWPLLGHVSVAVAVHHLPTTINSSFIASRFHPSSVQLISLNLPSQSTALATRVSRLIDAFMPLRPLAGATVDAPNSTASLSGRWPHREFMFAYHHHHIIIIIIIHSLIHTYIYI